MASSNFWNNATKNANPNGVIGQQQTQTKAGPTSPDAPNGWVWDNRDWVPYDPTNPRHKGLPVYGQGWTKTDNSIPYYSQDQMSLLSQYTFPGAAAGQTFSTMFLEPQRQQAIRDALAQLTPEQRQHWIQTLSGRMQDFSNMQTGNDVAAVQGAGQQQGQQTAQQMKGMGYDNSTAESAILDAHNATLKHIAKIRSDASTNLQGQIGQLNATQGDPLQLAMQRMGVAGGGMENPMLQQIMGMQPGLEQQRQNSSFFGNLLNGAMNYFGSGGGTGNLFSGMFKTGGGGGKYGGLIV